MLASAFRLADRLGRLVLKSGLKLGETAGALIMPARPAPALGARPRPANAAEPGVIHVRLQRQHVPVFALLVLINVGLIMAATLMMARAAAPPPLPTSQIATPFLPTLAPTEFAVAALDPADVEDL